MGTEGWQGPKMCDGAGRLQGNTEPPRRACIHQTATITPAHGHKAIAALDQLPACCYCRNEPVAISCTAAPPANSLHVSCQHKLKTQMEACLRVELPCCATQNNCHTSSAPLPFGPPPQLSHSRCSSPLCTHPFHFPIPHVAIPLAPSHVLLILCIAWQAWLQTPVGRATVSFPALLPLSTSCTTSA